MSDRLRDRSINSFGWKTAHSVCTLGMTFIIQLVLARMLAPEDFGIIALTTVFMTLANTIIETSFSSTIVQRSALNQTLTSSVFYTNLALSVVVYLLLYFVAPFISKFYNEPILTLVLRVQGVRIIVSGFYSIQQALMNRKMRFKAIFWCGLLGSIGQAIVGLLLAYLGAGIWALVISTLASCIISGLAMIIVEPWKPSFCFSFVQVKDALSYSSNILAIRVVRKLFYNIRTLAIGKVYGTETLGFFNKGFQFPSTAMTVVDGSLTSVAFTSLSKLQDNVGKLLSSLRTYVRMAMFLCTPLMLGMFCVAEPMVKVLLTEKWLECVPFLKIICITQLFIPLNLKTTAIEALGNSKLSMKIHISGIIISIGLLIASIPFSPLVMTFSGIISTIVLQIIIAIYSKRVLNYSFTEQLFDATCGLLPSLVMMGIIFISRFIRCENVLLQLSLEIFLGAFSFILISGISQNSTFMLICELIQSRLSRISNANKKKN